MTDAGGSHCPVCEKDSGVDAEDWSRHHKRTDPAVCVSCGAKLNPYYDETWDGQESWWGFEPIDEEQKA